MVSVMPGEEGRPERPASVPVPAVPPKPAARWARIALVLACVLGVAAAGGAVVLVTRGDPLAASNGPNPPGVDGVDAQTSAGVTTSVSPTSTPTAKPTTRPPTTTRPSGPQNCRAYPAFPDANCTGVPAGIRLTKYSGPCTIKTAKTVINAKLISCALRIQATGVVIKNSRINGTVGTPNGSTAYSFTIMDSEVHAPRAGSVESQGVGDANFTMLRVEVTGGNRSVYCRKNCRVEDSWVHGQDIADSPRIHASGIRQSQGSKIIHNRIHCSAEDTSSGGGCSADLTGYGDFEPVRNNLIEKNLFVATPAGACAYGGSSGDDGTKPYGDQAEGIKFIDNVFERGPARSQNGQRLCGYYFPITDFNSNRPGNQWVNNRWDDGKALPPAN
jgi:hypothetical protein